MTVATASSVNVEALLTQLKPLKSGNKLYMLLDAARDPKIYPAVKQFGRKSYRSLFPVKAVQDLATVAPYLLQLDRRTKATKALLEDAWGRSWGVFLESSDTLEAIQQHFQGLLLVKDETGRPLHFRYYDPRVLRIFLPTCNDAELQAVLGSSIVRFWVESEDGKSLVEFPPKTGKSSPIQ